MTLRVQTLRIQRDERGAIMLIALFFAVFAVGLLYYSVGIGQAVLFRERMQAATDAAALSAAVIHARAMNFVVLINIVMAALLAILVTLKVVEGLAILGIAIAAGLAFVTAGGSLAAVPPLKALQSETSQAYEQLKPDVFEALEVLNKTQDTVKQLAPVVADELAMADLKAHSSPPVKDGFVAGSRLTLPIEDDSFEKLCGKAGEYTAALAMLPVEPLLRFPGGGKAKGVLKGAMGALAQSMPQWFCGEGSGSPPTTEITVDRWYPVSDHEIACAAPASAGDSAQEAISKACEHSETINLQAKPDPDTGACRAGNNCSLGGPYDRTVTEARVACDPVPTPRPSEYHYQLREGVAEYRWNGQQWVRLSAEYDTPRLQKSGRAPCGPEWVNPQVAVGYNLIVHPESDVDVVLPLCTTEAPPLRVVPPGVGDTEAVKFEEVTHMLACKRRERETADISNGETAGSNAGNDKSPKRVEQDAELGDENFQLRALAYGDRAFGGAERMVNLSLWDEQPPPDPLSSLTALGEYSFSQAEYFYNGSEAREAWLWTMKWRARLHRFRLPEEDGQSELLYAGCGRSLGPSRCVTLLGALHLMADAIVH